jgi:hypothetical protein
MDNISQDKRIIFYRDARDYFAEERVICFNTIPFLRGVGCGNASLEDSITYANKAKNAGYEVVLLQRQSFGKYPLDPEDLKILEERLRGN